MSVKNGYSRILGILFLVVVFAAIVSVIYYWQTISDFITFHAPIHEQGPAILNYKNIDYQFQFSYDRNYKLDVSNTQANYFKDTTSLVSVSIPNSVFPKTNLNSASLTVAVKDTPSANCANYVSSADTIKKMTNTITLPAGKFYNVQVSGAAAGTTYTTMIYRIFYNKLCYEINQTVGVSNIQNYDPSSGVTEVIVADVWNELSKILLSFKFVDTSMSDNMPSGTLSGHITVDGSTASQDVYDAIQVIVYSSDKSQVVQKVNVNSAGDYSVSLASDIYYVSYSSIYNYYQPTMKKVTITTDQITTANFSITTGAR